VEVKQEVNDDDPKMVAYLHQQRLISNTYDPNDTLGYNVVWVESLNDHHT
jgi:hypothetical protein